MDGGFLDWTDLCRRGCLTGSFDPVRTSDALALSAIVGETAARCRRVGHGISFCGPRWSGQARQSVHHEADVAISARLRCTRILSEY
jgi:hypothetical protein